MVKRAIISGVLFVALLAGSLAQPVAVSAKRPSRVRRIAPGVVYKRFDYRRPRVRVHMVSIDPGAASTLDTVLATNRLAGFERTSSMARRSKALVAINGDYARPNGQPVHLFANDGRVMQTALVYGRNFGVDKAETESYFGHPKPQLYASEIDDLIEHRINRVNVGSPNRNQMHLYTPESVGVSPVPSNACSARMYPSSTTTFNAGGTSETTYEVDSVACRERRMARLDGNILSTPMDGNRSDEFVMPGISPGDRLTVDWNIGWPGVVDTVGGNPLLMENGRIVWSDVRGSHPYFRRHPRTGVGVRESGRILFLVVDGRWKKSRGMTLARFAREFKRLGATWALNLDGGGSSTMVIKGDVVNRPSDRRERGVSSALVLLRGPDPGDPPPGTSVPTSPAGIAAVHDAASTGGLLSAAVEEGGVRSAFARRLARRFAASRSR